MHPYHAGKNHITILFDNPEHHFYITLPDIEIVSEHRVLKNCPPNAG